jgi:hypothetical protein
MVIGEKLKVNKTIGSINKTQLYGHLDKHWSHEETQQL